MLEVLKKEKYPLIILTIIFIIFCFISYLKQINPFIDFGREVYFASQMLKGEVLYKDIFNVYTPLGYQVNAALFFIFGQKISVLNIVGFLLSYLILLMWYLISRTFLNKLLTFFICLFLCIISIFNLTVFNFNTPYSSSLIYGMVCFLASILFLFKYYNNDIYLNNKYLYLFALFSGFSIAFKYEYVLFPFFAYLFMLVTKKLDVKKVIISIILLSLPLTLSFIFLFLQGLKIEDLIYNVNLITKMSKTDTLNYFYSFVGQNPDFKLFIFSTVSFVKLFLYLLFLYTFLFLTKKYKLKLIEYIFIILFIYISFKYISRPSIYNKFSLLTILFTILNIINIKKIYKNKQLLILNFASIISSVKSFFHLNLNLYGSIFLPLILIAIISTINYLIEDKNKKEIIQKMIIIVLIITTFIFVNIFLNNYKCKSFIINSNGDKGNKIYGYNYNALVINREIEYIKKVTNENDTVLIMPEGHIINYLTDRKSDNFYHSIMPVYVEMFGQENIINHLSLHKPKLIVFHNRNLTECGTPYICKNYAQDVCKWVYDNYRFENKIEYNNVKLINFLRVDK